MMFRTYAKSDECLSLVSITGVRTSVTLSILTRFIGTQMFVAALGVFLLVKATFFHNILGHETSLLTALMLWSLQHVTITAIWLLEFYLMESYAKWRGHSYVTLSIVMYVVPVGVSLVLLSLVMGLVVPTAGHAPVAWLSYALQDMLVLIAFEAFLCAMIWPVVERHMDFTDQHPFGSGDAEVPFDHMTLRKTITSQVHMHKRRKH